MSTHQASGVSSVHPEPIPPRRLWRGVLLAPAAWIAQGSLGWYFGYEACAGLGAGGARTALAILSAIALLAAGLGWWTAWTNWGCTTSERHPTRINAWDRVEFMSAGGVLVSTVFILGIAWASLSPVLLHECGGMR